MNIALCLTGFIRNINYINSINLFYNKINSSNLKSITIFYSCPDKIEEDDEYCFDKNKILNLFKKIENDKIKININFRNYNKDIFKKNAKELNLPLLTSTNYHPYRVISCLNGFSETAKLVNDNKYNFVIFSRLDIICHILSINEIFNNISILDKTAYIWRTIPYVTNQTPLHVEDRFFICSNDCVSLIKYFYDNLYKLNIGEKDFGIEKILSFSFQYHQNIKTYHLYNLKVMPDFNRYTEWRAKQKSSKEFIIKHLK